VPSRKQRRRRAKDRRHEYEYVYVDEEGREVEVEDEDNDNREQKRPDRKAAPTTRTGRTVQPASWTRVGRRALIFGPLMFITIRFLERNEAISVSIVRTLTLLLLFLPFSYVMDTLIYRSYLRRTGQAAGRRR
jgi:hypothetical protein